jgi:small GTP-binding protein
VGDGMVGKTNYVLALMSLNQEIGNLSGTTNLMQILGLQRQTKDYNPTLGVEVHPVVISNTTFNVWDCAGQERFGGLRDGYYLMGDAAIIMFDNMASFESAKGKWTLDIRRTLENVPIVYIWSKYDSESEDREIEYRESEYRESEYRESEYRESEYRELEKKVKEFDPENSKVFKINSKKRTGLYEPFEFLLSELSKLSKLHK